MLCLRLPLQVLIQAARVRPAEMQSLGGHSSRDSAVRPLTLITHLKYKKERVTNKPNLSH